MTRLVDIFQSRMQTKLIEYLLSNRDKVFNQATLARYLNCSPSTVARIIEPLISEQILMYERFDQGMKILCLNLEGEKTKALLDFYERLKAL
jgi:AraC-like DNA-binding protein